MSKAHFYFLTRVWVWKLIEVFVSWAVIELLAVAGVQPSTMIAMEYTMCFHKIDDLTEVMVGKDKMPHFFGVAGHEAESIKCADPESGVQDDDSAQSHYCAPATVADPRMAMLPPSLVIVISDDLLHLPLFPEVGHPKHDRMLDYYVSSVCENFQANLWSRKIADLNKRCAGLRSRDYERAGMMARCDALTALQEIRESMAVERQKVVKVGEVSKDEISVPVPVMSGFRSASVEHELNDISITAMVSTCETQDVLDVADSEVPCDGSAERENGESERLADARRVLPPSVVEALAFDLDHMHLFLPLFPAVGDPDRSRMLDDFFSSVYENFRANLLSRKIADLDNRCAGIKKWDFEMAGMKARKDAIKVLRESAVARNPVANIPELCSQSTKKSSAKLVVAVASHAKTRSSKIPVPTRMGVNMPSQPRSPKLPTGTKTTKEGHK
ncbi:hypothetical protein V1514DRAFT_342968 [Lipomyces japonicus]|uniref:uncharacterized protein n=1 Tax=Lipomyces japonicus TaxID=56871 RepID=UPI0034CF582F